MKSKHKLYKPSNIDSNNMLPGDPKGLPDESFFNEKTLVFIDEAFLSKLSKYFGKGKYLKFDRFSFAENLAKKQKSACNKIFLYIAPPYQNPLPLLENEKRKEGYDNFIRQLKSRGISVREGRCQRLKINEEIIYNKKQ